MPSHKKNITAKHPNSRQVLKIAKKEKQKTARDKSKLVTQHKQSVIHAKLLWFRENVPKDGNYTREEFKMLIETYIGRFNAEIEELKQADSIGNRKNQANKSAHYRKLTMARDLERNEFNSGGIEVPDLLDAAQIKLLREWNEDIRYLPLFRLKRYSKKSFT